MLWLPLGLLVASTLTVCLALLMMEEVSGATVLPRIRRHREPCRAEGVFDPGDIAELREAFARIVADHLAGRDLTR